MRGAGRRGGKVEEIHGGGVKRIREAVSRKKDAHKAMCRNSTEENKRRHGSLKNKENTSFSKATREKAEEAPIE